jgi:ketosteroid isomerase-like protein
MRSSLLLVVLLGCATAPAASDARKRDLLAEVKVAVEEFDGAQLKSDRAVIDRYLADDFVFTRGSGVVGDRKSFIDSFTNPSLKLDPFQITNHVYKVLGDSAVIVSGEVTLSGTEDGKAFSEHFRYTDIYEWRGERWQVVWVQVTMIK